MQSFDSLFLTNCHKPIAALVDEKKSLNPPPLKKETKQNKNKKKETKTTATKLERLVDNGLKK